MKQMDQITLVVTLLLIVSACDRTPKIRRYTEIVREPTLKQDHAAQPRNRRADTPNPNSGSQDIMSRAMADMPLIWTLPNGWVEESGSGLRLATFHSTDEDPVTCTMVSLEGDSGGTQANVQRWLRQFQLELSPEALAAFLRDQKSFRSEGDLPIQLIDIRALQTGQLGRIPSLIAAIISLDDKTVFFKMTGSLNAVNNHHSAFESLLQFTKLP